jgi:hypothetical protein
VATYPAALICDTAVPAWHEGYPEMPFVFAGSSATAAGGLGLLAAPLAQSAPARALATFGVAIELAAVKRMEHRIGMVGEPYSKGSSGVMMKIGEFLSIAGLAGAYLGRDSRAATATSGVALLAASAFSRWGIFHAGMVSADDPRPTVEPQRARLQQRADAQKA